MPSIPMSKTPRITEKGSARGGIVQAGNDDDGDNNISTDHERGPPPSAQDLRVLKRVPEKIPPKVFSIAFVELVERLSYYGTVQVFVNFIQQPNPGTPTGKPVDPSDGHAQPGALGLGQRASTALTTFNQFWVFLVPLMGAYVADTYLGRFKTIFVSVIIALAGHLILVASAIPPVISHPQAAMGVFIVGLIVMGVGTGGFKPNISPLIAEQIPNKGLRVVTNSDGQRVIVDPAVTTSTVYHWFYLFINIGSLVGQLSMVYAERYAGFYLAFLLPTAAFVLTIPVLLVCRKMYTLTPPEGSVLGPAFKLLIRATRGRWHMSPIATYRHMHDGTFWESVKPSKTAPESRPSWYTFNDAWVDEVARGFAACGVFLWYPLYWLSYNQINNNLTSQAATMALGGIPNDILANLDPLALIILIPVFNLGLYPVLRKMGIRFTPIKKITAGFFTAAMAMIWACVIQVYM